MSIAILTQVYDEMRRLAIAGSVVAAGDFRLKKLLPALEQAGAKAPVFAKVAEAVKAVVEANEQTSADALLELTTLVNAILYTQGATGSAGALAAIETTDLGVPAAQSSSRILKPLLEALSTTGSGRHELIHDAVERGAFRDLRLVKPALDALDDVYGPIGDLVAEKVLPLYGKAILPELRAKFDVKGRGGHPRRLQLMHQLDPAGTRELVKQALDAGSKEVKVVAIECLGADKEDLSYLLEQAAAKSQDVRQAAFRALANVDDDAAVKALQKAITGKDLSLAVRALHDSRNGTVLDLLISEAESEIASLAGTKDKKEISAKIDRAELLLGCLAERQDKQSETFLLHLFDQRDELAKIKGATTSGSDLNQKVVQLMCGGSKKLQTTLAEAHASLANEELSAGFHAARQALSPAQVFEKFSPYLTTKVDEKKKQRDPAWARREVMIEALGGTHYYYLRRDENEPPHDPRWLDVGVGLENINLVRLFARPGHAPAAAFLKERFDAVLKKSKDFNECHEVLSAMVESGHPQATDAFIAVCEKHKKKADYYMYWFARLIPDLPKSALPRLEALLPSLSEKMADTMIDYLQQLRDKK